MAPKACKRRSPGEGSVWPYQTTTGERWAIGHPSFGTRRNASGWGKTKREAQEALRAMLVDSSRGELIDPSKQPTGDFLDEWATGCAWPRRPIASYRKNIRLHIKPAIGAVPLAALTTERIDRLYRELERGGRADYREGEGLSPRTVRYMHTILVAALRSCEDRRLARNPAADRAADGEAGEGAGDAPVDGAARLPGLGAGARRQLPAVARAGLHRHAPRRGPALRWRDVSLDESTVRIRRSAGMVRVAGESAGIVEGDTKSGKPRLVDLDVPTVAVLRARKRERGALALQLARDDALVFGDIEGEHAIPSTSPVSSPAMSRAAAPGSATRRCR